MTAAQHRSLNLHAKDKTDHADLMGAIARDRDRMAFTALFNHFAPRLKGFVMGMGIAPEAAEEIAQEVMLTAWNKAHLFDPARANVATWLYTIARNRRIDLARRAAREKLDPAEPMLQGTPPAHPDNLVAATQRDDALHRAIAALPDEQAQIIRLAMTRGWSHGEIARHTGLPLGTVKSRIRLAFARLRKTIGPDADL
ncbi:MAG TPA: RNA polymerase subunit sigma [Alphaproteobacteria bacterium]|nr:RNA polymerase subunit sigma [Alphaproteobacteria bacterium]HAM47032.1 RNA polymerase subunit sigma [Alphaproteobacteria bacterium]HBF97743.1 RNA polymerase subunit sigma [Alphaproteobacteria bacterium]HCO89405.1 RNA polymerase subunit sigma [Alphaproteobacteria bacterium]